jgi:hypothetical protein
MSTYPNELPIACDLTAISAADREYHVTVVNRLFATVQSVEELPDGYSFQLPSEMLVTAAEFISRERLCCPFFRFGLEIEPGSDSIWMKLSGNDDVKQFVLAEFPMLTDKLT